MGDNTFRRTTHSLGHHTQIKTLRNQTPFEAMHETCRGDEVLHLEMEYPILKRNSQESRTLRGPSPQLGPYVRLRVLMSDWSASLL